MKFVAEQSHMEAAIEAVLDRAFGPGRFAKSSERVREQGAVLERDLSRVALTEAGAVVGVCRMWRVRAGEAELLFLGPLAVDPSAQGEGVGAALAKEALAAARAQGARGVVVMGREAFFGPLGFAPVPPGAISLPGPYAAERLLWLELAPGGLAAVRGTLSARCRT